MVAESEFALHGDALAWAEEEEREEDVQRVEYLGTPETGAGRVPCGADSARPDALPHTPRASASTRSPHPGFDGVWQLRRLAIGARRKTPTVTSCGVDRGRSRDEIDIG